MNTDAWKILRYALSRQALFVLAASGLLGLAIGVQQSWQSGAKVAIYVFLFGLAVFVWVDRGLIRMTFFHRSADR